MGLRFVHTGDLHLDSPFLGIGQAVPERVAIALRDATLRSWDRIVGLAVDALYVCRKLSQVLSYS